MGRPGFYTYLELPDVGAPVVLNHRVGAPRTVLRLRYEFVGSLDPVARRLVGRNRLSWVQATEIEPSGTRRLTFWGEVDPLRLHGSAGFTLAPDGAERIVPGLLRRLDIEAGSVNDLLAS